MSTNKSNSLGPILCAHLLARVDQQLIDLLHSLAPGDWNLPTIAPLWRVKDVAAHLLDTALRKLSFVRDGARLEIDDSRTDGIVGLVNRLNHEGVTVFRRLSPGVLIDLMKSACAQSARFHETLDPFAPAALAVSWAGEDESLNWFDTARELTERWHHQQQIRLATRRPGLMTPELYHPVLDCFIRGLPHAYREIQAISGTTMMLEITGDCGGQWFLRRETSKWRLIHMSEQPPESRVTIPQELAWRVFTKAIDRDSALAQVRIDGDRDLGENVLRLTAIVG